MDKLEPEDMGDEPSSNVPASASPAADPARLAADHGPGYATGSTLWHSSEEDGGPDVGIQIGLGGGYSLYCGEMAKATLEENDIDLEEWPDGWWLVLYGPTEQWIVGGVPEPYRAQEALEHIAGRLLALAAGQSLTSKSEDGSSQQNITPPKALGAEDLERPAGGWSEIGSMEAAQRALTFYAHGGQDGGLLARKAFITDADRAWATDMAKSGQALKHKPEPSRVSREEVARWWLTETRGPANAAEVERNNLGAWSDALERADSLIALFQGRAA